LRSSRLVEDHLEAFIGLCVQKLLEASRLFDL